MAQKLKLHSPVGADPLILKWPVPTSEGKDGPEEILDTIRLVCEDFPDFKTPLETRILKEGEDVSNYDYEQTKAMCEKYNKAIDSFRQLVKGHPRQKTMSKQASMKQLKHILQQCYNHSVKDPEKLNHYEPFSPEVYGETSFELVEQMIKYVKFSENDYFIDLGSGVGQVVLQVSAATNCKFCYGVEKAEWPAEYAVGMEKEFQKWMKWYGKEHGEFKIEKGDFLHDGVKEKLSKATIVFVNNFAFGPVVDHELKQRFANCLKEGARIVSSKAFCPLNFRITARNLSDIGTIMQVEELSPLCGAVSWTGKPFAYYVHTIDRTLLEKYFNQLRHPSKKEEIEPRKDRKGRPLLSIKDKINGALSAGSDSNSSGRWRRVRGLQREKEMVSPLSAAKVLDFDSGSNSSFTNSGGAPTVDDSSIVYGPTTRRQWNEYVKRPQSQSGTENDNDSSAADVATIDVKSKDQAEEITQKKKRMKTVKRLNNGALGKRQMQVGKKAEPLSPVKSKAAVKLRPRQTTRSSAPKRTVAASAASTASSVSTTTSSASSNLTAHTNGTVLPPSLDSLNLLHAHTVMSTSGKDPAEKVNYNDRRMTETSSAYFKPTVQKQTVSMLEKEAGFLQMIETMKQRFLSFLTFMQSPEYRAMLLLQIEQEKRKNTSLKGQTDSLERDISMLQKDGVRLIKDRLKEMGIKADSPRELISQAKDIMLRHQELKSQTASLGAQINALQTEHNHKITAYRKVLDRKFAMRPENSFCEYTYHMLNKEHLDQQRLLANINRLHTEIQHLQNVNKSYVIRPDAGNAVNNSLDIGLNLALEGKGVLKSNGIQGRPPVNSYTAKEKLDMKENYEAFGTVLAMVKREVTAAMQESPPLQTGGLGPKSEADTQITNVRQDTLDSTLTGNTDVKSNTPPSRCVQDVNVKTTQSNTIQSFKAPEALVKENDSSVNMPHLHSSWTSDVRKEGAVTSTSPRILPPGMKIDIKKPSRLNGLNSTLKAKTSHPTSYTLIQSTENIVNQSYKTNANGSFSKVPTFNLYTENEKSAAEDLISLKDILSTPTTNIEHQGPLLNSVPMSSFSSTSLSSIEYVQNHTIDSKASIRKHSSHDNKPTSLVTNKPHIGSSNSLSKDSSVSCAITPASSTSHVFAQVPVANLSQTGSISQFTIPNNQILSTASSIQVRSGQSKVKIVTSLPKNGVLKHKNYDSSLIQRPVKVRTVEAGNEAKLSVPTILSSAFYAQSQQQAQIVQAPSNLTHVLKSESGHPMSNQSFLNAHMNQTVVVSSGNGTTVGSASLPFVTIQSPHAIPVVSSGSNGIQPPLIKILQQKPLMISPKSSSVFNGTTNNISCNGSLIAVSSPALASQGTLGQGESIGGQAVKILPPNGRDAKGCLHSPDPCSLVVSEFDAIVPECKNNYGGRTFQDGGQQTPDSDVDTVSEISEETVHNINSSSDGINSPSKRRRVCCSYPKKFCKCQREPPEKSLKLSADSDVSSPGNMRQISIPKSPAPTSDGHCLTMKDNSPKNYSNSLSVILKREAKLEKMAECISDNESITKRTSNTQSRSADYGKLHTHFQNNYKESTDGCSHFQTNRSGEMVLEKPASERNVGNKTQISPKTGIFVLPPRKCKPASKKHHQYSGKSSVVSELVLEKKPVDETKLSDPETKISSATDKLSGVSDRRLNHRRSRKDERHSQSYRNHQTYSSCRNKNNKAKLKDKRISLGASPEPNIVQCATTFSVELVGKAGSTNRKPSVALHSSADLNSVSIEQEKHSVQSENVCSPKPEQCNKIPESVQNLSDYKVENNDNDCHSPNYVPFKEEKSLLSVACRSVSPKLEKHSPTESARRGPEKFTVVDIYCSPLKSETHKPEKRHTSSKGYKSRSSASKKSSNSSKLELTKEQVCKEKSKMTRQRSYDEKRSSYSRSSSHGKRHENPAKSSRKHSCKEKDMSPGPPKLERAISPPRKNAVRAKSSSPNSENADTLVSDAETKSIDLWSHFCENSDKRSSRDRFKRRKFSSGCRGKTTTSNCHKQSKEPSPPPRPANQTFSKTETSISPKITRNSISARQERISKENDIKSVSRNISKKLCESKTETMRPYSKNKSDSKPASCSRSSRTSETRSHAELNDDTSTKCIAVCEILKSEKTSTRNISSHPVHKENSKEMNRKKCSMKELGQSKETFPPKDTEQSEPLLNVESETILNAEMDKAEPSGDFSLSSNLDSPYGMLTPKSMSRSCHMEEDRHSDSSGGENLQQNDGKINLKYKHGLTVDIGITHVHLNDSFEGHDVVTAVPAPEAESFPFPPTPGKTPRSASVPCSPSTETNNIQTIEETVRIESDEVKPDDSVDNISARKGPQTPPGSPLFNHQSQSRSRSPSVSSSSSRGSSYDSCHSTSSSSSISDCSSDDTKKRKQHIQNQKTPPRKLSSLLLPVSLGIGSPPKATVLYSPMPSPNINGFNYGVQIRPGLGPTSAPAFGNYGMIGTSALSPLSVSTQQSPGYQMVTSDSLRSPNGLIRSPVSGGLIRQHPVFPNILPSPCSSQSYTSFKENNSLQSSKSFNSAPTEGENKKMASEAVKLDQDKAGSFLLDTKVLPPSSGRLSSVDSHITEKGTYPSRVEAATSSSPKNHYTVMDSSDIVIDYNANNTSLSCSHSSHQQETHTAIDYNQNLCLLSTSCCPSPERTAGTTAIDAQKSLLTPEASSLSCTSKLNPQFSTTISDIKTSSETAETYSSSPGRFANLVMEKNSYKSSLLAPLVSPSTSTSLYTPTVSRPNDCTTTMRDSFNRSMQKGQSIIHELKPSNSYTACSLHQQQEIHYHPRPAVGHQNSANQNHQLNHLPQSKQQSQIEQPLQQHLPSCHQTSSPPPPPPLPHNNLYMSRPVRQKGQAHSPHPSHCGPYPHHAYKGHNLGHRRAGFVSRLPLSHYPPHWGHVSSQVYPGHYCQNGPPNLSKPRHTQPLGQPPGARDIGDCGLLEHMHSGMMEYPFHGTTTQSYGSGQWENPGPPYCMGSGSGGLGRSFHQHYNHLYHDKHHH